MTVYTDGDHCKTTIKDEETIAPKMDEKQCNNPLTGLANTVNAITNGVVGDESQIIPISATVIVNNKQAPPKAMVKPQVLTHVIEGFVIQEGKITSLSINYIYIAILNITFTPNQLSNINICFFLIYAAASEPFAVSQETTNILNRNNTITEKDAPEEPPSKYNTFTSN